jgi:transposase
MLRVDAILTRHTKEIVRHLSEDDLDRLLTQTDDEKVTKQLTFIKRLYKRATLEDAADDVGMPQSAGSRWTRLWNMDRLGLLTPSFGDDRRPRVDEKQRERLLDCSKSLSPKRNRRSSTSSTESFI